MVKNKPNTPDDIKITPDNEQIEPVKEATSPEMTADEAASLAHEGEAALYEIGGDGLEPPTPFDIPALGEVVVPFDKINENMSEKQEAQEGKSEDTRKAPEEQHSEAEPKRERKPRSDKQTPADETVKRLFREFAGGGDSGRNIAAKLNAEGLDTPAEYYFKQTGKRATRGDNGQQWGSCTIIQLLRNQVYIGDMVQCKRKVSSFKTKKRLVTNPDDWVIVEDTHEPIIDRLTWDSVQKRLDSAGHAHSNHAIKVNSTDEVNTFLGIIRCADLGAAMVFNHRVEKSGVVRWFYR